MALTALNRSTVALLTNQSGGSVAQGDVVIIDSANASSFTTTTTGAYASGFVGVVLEPNGIASAASGLVAVGGYVPKVNLSASASLGDLFKTHTVAKQAVRHAGPIVSGDVGEVLATGTTPAALLWGQPASGGGSSITNTLLVDFQLATDISALGIVGTAWTDYLANQSFTKTVAGSKIIINVAGCCFGGCGASSASVGGQMVVDSAGTPITRPTGGGFAPGNFYANLVGCSIVFTGLASGSHTVKLQARCQPGNSGSVFCRPVTQADESLTVQVWEIG